MADAPPPNVKRAIDAHPKPMRQRLLDLRELIHEIAASDPDIGPLEEALKWGEPAFLTPSGSGTTVRINAHKKSGSLAGLYVHCQTDLVDRWRVLYGDQLSFDGNRAILLDVDAPLPKDALRHCIAMALTYHRDK